MKYDQEVRNIYTEEELKNWITGIKKRSSIMSIRESKYSVNFLHEPKKNFNAYIFNNGAGFSHWAVVIFEMRLNIENKKNEYLTIYSGCFEAYNKIKINIINRKLIIYGKYIDQKNYEELVRLSLNANFGIFW